MEEEGRGYGVTDGSLSVPRQQEGSGHRERGLLGSRLPLSIRGKI